MNRRQFLAISGTAGLAGCSAWTGKRDESEQTTDGGSPVDTTTDDWTSNVRTPDEEVTVDVSSPLYTTDPAEGEDRVVVTEGARDVQDAIDWFAENDVSGVVQLLPKTYTPSQTIELKGGVTVLGAGHVNIRAPNAYSWFSAANLADGTPLVRWRPNAEEYATDGAQLVDVGLAGERKDGVEAYGLSMPSTVSNPRLVRCFLTEFYHSGMTFAGTQSAEIRECRVTRCGVAANDTHGLDAGGAVQADDFDRATVICTGLFGNGPASDASPVKLRNGSTLRMKPSPHRNGVRGHGPMDVPLVDIDGGDFVMDDGIITTNLKGTLSGIRIRNGGSAVLRNTTVEKADPNIYLEAGSLTLSDCYVAQAKQYDHSNAANGMGDGIFVADSGKAEEYRLDGVGLVGNKRDGIFAGRPGTAIHDRLSVQSNGRYGINAPNGMHVMMINIDADKPNGSGLTNGPVTIEHQYRA